MSRNPVMKRKPPYHHTVSAHTRSGIPIRSFTRGTGEPVSTPSPGRRRRVVGGKIVTRDVLTGTTLIRPMRPRKPGRGVGLPPKRPPLEPPTFLPMPSEPPPLTGPTPVPMPFLVGPYEIPGYEVSLPPGLSSHDILMRSNQLLAMYKQDRPVWEKIGIAAELKNLSNEHRQLTGTPTTMENIRLKDLFTKKQLEEYNRRVRRLKK